MMELGIKQKRVMMYFIEATQELILEDGIENLSIKKIAEKAGYNSATIYNYFENLEELILYASINYLKKYLQELKGEILPNMKAVEIYRIVYKIFTRHSFEQPEIFYTLFFGKYSDRLDSVIKKYYEIFPQEIEGQLDLTKAMLTQGDIHSRDVPIINQMIKEGDLKKEEAFFIMESIVRVHHSYLTDLLQKKITVSFEEHYNNFFKVFDFLLMKK